jgi:hypothetical protein
VTLVPMRSSSQPPRPAPTAGKDVGCDAEVDHVSFCETERYGAEDGSECEDAGETVAIDR